MSTSRHGVRRLLAEAARAWSRHDALTQSAAMAFYSLTSLAPLLVIAVGIAGAVLDTETVRSYVVDQTRRILDPTSADLVADILSTAWVQDAPLFGSLLAGAVFVFSSTAAFNQLVGALNRVWEGEVRTRGVLPRFARGRLVSAVSVLALGLTLLISLLINTVLSGFAARLEPWLPFTTPVFRAAEILTLLGLLWVLLTLLFQYLPDRRLPWTPVLAGAGATSCLLTVGTILIGLYLGKALPASAFGAAGSAVVLCLWVYYSCMVMLYGAELTRAYEDSRVRDA